MRLGLAWCGAWGAGWVALLRRDEPAGYRDLRWRERVLLDHLVVVRACCAAGFWRGALFFLATSVLAQSWIWQHDLRGAARDAVYLVPTALVAPLAARGRRRRLARVLRERAARLS
jgi:hypothetical protein